MGLRLKEQSGLPEFKWTPPIQSNTRDKRKHMTFRDWDIAPSEFGHDFNLLKRTHTDAGRLALAPQFQLPLFQIAQIQT
jgi:hypothetical protein